MITTLMVAKGAGMAVGLVIGLGWLAYQAATDRTIRLGMRAVIRDLTGF